QVPVKSGGVVCAARGEPRARSAATRTRERLRMGRSGRERENEGRGTRDGPRFRGGGTNLSLPPQWGEPCDLDTLPGPQRVPQVPVLLQSQPELGTHAEHARQTKGRVRRDTPLAPDDLVQARKRHTELHGKRRLRDAQGLEEF